MPNWAELLGEGRNLGGSVDVLRRKYIRKLAEKTGRNVIVYYSGWLQRDSPSWIRDDDKNGFMSSIHGLDRKLGLDLVLHTQGGDLAATESIVDYLTTMFETDIRAFVPQIAMSGGTLMACACKEIFMGKQSNLGPVDPQIGGTPAHGILEEFDKALEAIKDDPATIPLWQAILGKYPPALLGECAKVVRWSDTLLKTYLARSMFSGEIGPEAKQTINTIANELGDHALTLSHARHLSADTCQKIGLKVRMIEEDQELQDLVLSVHHSCMLTFAQSQAFKIIQNQKDGCFIQSGQ